MKKMLVLLSVLFMFGCMHTDVMQYDRIDNTDKTIAMFPDAIGVYTKLGTILRSNGFQVYIKNKARDTGAEITKTRYELYAHFVREDTCITGGGLYNYAISMADLKTGQEVFVMSGRECQRTIEKKFRQILHDTTK
jgi:hypothetical protein